MERLTELIGQLCDRLESVIKVHEATKDEPKPLNKFDEILKAYNDVTERRLSRARFVRCVFQSKNDNAIICRNFEDAEVLAKAANEEFKHLGLTFYTNTPNKNEIVWIKRTFYH